MVFSALKNSLKPIVIAGPTGSGKSALAIKLARAIDGEIICADSRQIYAGMQVGSCAPTRADMKTVPHHGYGVVEPNTAYDAQRFIQDTDMFVADIFHRGRMPILVGGTGLYLRAWKYGLSDVPAKDPLVRAALLCELKELGTEALHARLEAIDSAAAARISKRDGVRIVRALEINAMTGQSPSMLRKSHLSAKNRVDAHWFLLTSDRARLSMRLTERVKNMFANGLLEEAVALRACIEPGHLLLETMGYKEALEIADQKIDLDTAILRIAKRHSAYAKRQATWFKKEDWWICTAPTFDMFEMLGVAPHASTSRCSAFAESASLCAGSFG